MTLRVEMSGTQRITYTQAWDIENRLAIVTNTVTGAVTRFAYDGDGKRTRKIENGQTTVYVGALEVSITGTQRITKTYYSVGAQMVAMRVVSPTGNVLYYLHGDHLGSVSVVVDGAGNATSQRFTPFGTPRWSSGAMPTDIGFTGQRAEATGLMFYQARYYSAQLGRFVSADTIVPRPGNPQSLNRYSYVLNSPLKYIDPTGHYTDEEIQQYLKDTYGKNWQSYWDAWQADPYWMAMLGKAQNNYILKTTHGPGALVFRSAGNSFRVDTPDGATLASYQGTGEYCLYDENVQRVPETEWVGMPRQGHLGLGLAWWNPPVQGGAYEPIYDYSGEKPRFTGKWMHVVYLPKITQVNITAGDSVPWLFSAGVAAISKYVLPMIGAAQYGPYATGVAFVWSATTGLNNMVVSEDKLFTEVWTSPAYRNLSGPTPCASWETMNPNGLQYPMPW